MVADAKNDLYQELKPLLQNPRFERDGSIASFCPIHEGDGKHKRRSLSLSPTKGLTCWAGCDFKEIVDALRGGQPRAYRPTGEQRAPERGPNGAPIAIYQYKDARGRVVAEKARFETGGSKTFRFRIPPSQEWGALTPLKERDLPLYGTEFVANTSQETPVYYVEGEKAANICRDKGLLVVTHVGGADMDDFGDALSVLSGRTVRLWPDNDEAGRRCMARVAAKLRGIAKRTYYVGVPLPMREKGDAADYFAAGGTVVALEAGQLDQPVTEYLAWDAVRVRVPTAKSVVTFTFTEIEKVGRAFEAELEIVVQGASEDPYTQRINLLSSSAQEGLRRSLDAMFGKETGWTGIVNTAIARARQAYLSQELAKRADQIADPGPQEFQVDLLLPRASAVVLFSAGGAGKTYLAMGLAVAVATGEPFLEFTARQGAVLYLDYETEEATWRRRMRRLYQGLSYEDVGPAPHYYWPGRGIPLVDQIERIRLFVEREGVSLIVVDSAAAACGGKPEDAETVLRYFGALAKLTGVTSLTIAHVPKNSSPEAPFGSAFWRNQPRRLWYVAAPEEEDQDVKEVGLICKKVNDGIQPKPVGVRLCFEGSDGPVWLEPCDPRSLPEVQSGMSLHTRIWDVLTEGPMAIYEITEALGLDKSKSGSVSATLRAGKNAFVSIPPDGSGRGKQARWARLSPQDGYK